MNSIVYNQDCMDGMKQYPDKYFDLACVDPPYGILSDAGDRLDKYGTGHKQWDSTIPNDSYFVELIRISKHQIIWGGNYFPYLWSAPCKGFVFWYKRQPITNWAAGEMAWTSYDKPARCFDYICYGGVNQDPHRFHPTQKPVALYSWIYHNYLPQGGKVLDTHLGSGSNRIAAHKAGNIDFVGYELDLDYYLAQEKRFQNYKSQLTIFDGDEFREDSHQPHNDKGDINIEDSQTGLLF